MEHFIVPGMAVISYALLSDEDKIPAMLYWLELSLCSALYLIYRLAFYKELCIDESMMCLPFICYIGCDVTHLNECANANDSISLVKALLVAHAACRTKKYRIEITEEVNGNVLEAHIF